MWWHLAILSCLLSWGIRSKLIFTMEKSCSHHEIFMPEFFDLLLHNWHFLSQILSTISSFSLFSFPDFKLFFLCAVLFFTCKGTKRVIFLFLLFLFLFILFYLLFFFSLNFFVILFLQFVCWMAIVESCWVNHLIHVK